MAAGCGGTASDELCRLVVLNTASIQLLPTTVAAVRSAQGCAASLDILPAVWLSSVLSVTAGLLAARLLQISRDMEELIDAFRPDEMSIEELFFSKNITTGIAVAHARGVILCAAEKKRLPIYEYTPMQVKQAVVGYGLADKKQVMDMTKRLLKLKAVPRPDDAADALAIALCHARSATSLLRRTNPGVKETV